MAKPNFFIVGAPKSGTTALYEYLNGHPNVYFPNKGVYYFCYDLTFRTPPIPESIYLNYYKSAVSQKAIGDAAVFNLLSPGAAVKIKAFNPEAKIIIMLRNPVQMIYSLHGENLANGDESIEDFETALNAEPARRKGKLIPPYHNCPLECLFYSSVAKYYEQVLRYKSVFSDDKIHFIFYDDFKSDTRLAYSKVLKFLELEEIFPSSFKVINPSKVPRSKTYLNFLLSPPRFIKSTGRFFFPHHSKRRQWLMDRLWNLNIKTKPRKPLSTELKQRLLNLYIGDIVELGNLLNRDLDGWLKIDNG
jgi:Sulfotransferase domain